MELSDAEKAFEIEVREWLATNLPADPDHVARDRDALIAWQRKLASKFVAQQGVQLHGESGSLRTSTSGTTFAGSRPSETSLAIAIITCDVLPRSPKGRNE